MPPKKSVEELDAELAALEAELAALESGAPAPSRPKPAKKKAKKARPPAPVAPAAPRLPEPEPEAPAAAPDAAPEPRSRFGLRGRAKSGRESKRFALPFGKRAKAGPDPAGEPEAAEGLAPGAEPEPESETTPEAMPAAMPGAPEASWSEPAAEPEAPRTKPGPTGPATAWEGRGGAWRARPAGPARVEVLRRQLDATGQVVAEESLGEEVEEPAAPEPQEAPRRRFSLFGGAPEAPEATPEGSREGPPPRARRRRLGLIPVALLALILLLALVLPAIGVDPLGLGDRVGVGGGGAAPTAAFAVSANVVALGDPVRFDADRSRDPAGGDLEYSWDFGDGGGGQGREVDHTYHARGEYEVRLTVRNAAGKTAMAEDEVFVSAPPTARAAATLGGSALSAENSAMAGDELTFSGAGSSGEGAITYQWEFGDGARAASAQATHAYAAAGSYRATLTVADGNGLRGNTSLAIYVGERSVSAGQADASLQGRVAVNTTVDVAGGGGALPYGPARLRATLTWNGTSPGGGPLPIPIPALPSDNLGLTIYDASGAVVATSEGDASPEEVVVTDFAGFAPGAWTVEVSRSQGGAQPIPFQLQVEVANGPA